MTRTSQALKRLGVAGVALVTVGAGLPALVATSASAAPATQISITPSSKTAATGTCTTFTVTVRDAAGNPADTGTVTVELTDPSPANNTTAGAAEQGTTNGDQSAQFCQLGGTPTGSTYTIVPPNQGVASPAGTGNDAPGSATSNRRSIQLTTDASGNATFGVVDSQEETVSLRAYTDADGNGTFNPNTDFQSAAATATFTPGNGRTDTTANQTANDNARTIVEVPPTTPATVIAGGSHEVVVEVKNASGDVVAGVTPRIRVQSGGANSNGTTNNPAATSAPREGTCGPTNNLGRSTCSIAVPNAGSDTFLVWVNQTNGGTPGPDASEPQITVTRSTSQAPNTIATQARNIDLTPEGPIDTTAGTSRTFTATVTDATGRAVSGVTVEFTRSGSAGRFTGTNANTATATTNNLGQATVTVSSAAGETGQSVVTATITTAGTQCAAAAGQGGAPATASSTAGNCSDSEVTNFVAASPSPSASPTGTSSPTASPTSSPSCAVTPTVTLEFGTINATGSSGVTVTAPANSQIQLLAYSQPSTTYRVVRQATIDNTGTPAQFRITPPTNTRLYAQIVGCTTDSTTASKVLNVRTTLSLNVTRTGTRAYRFFGDSLPARPGGLIVSLYRVTDSGSQVLTAQTRASASTGDWVINRVFTGTGRFGFVVRTGQDLQNAPGASNVRSLLIF